MLSFTESENAASAERYFSKSLARDDHYYVNSQEVPGQWLGKGAVRLRLQSEVDKESFVSLCRNRDPNTGKKLRVRDAKNARPGYDCTISACKAASVIDGLYGADDIRTAFQKTGRELITDKIEPLMHTRVRVGGRDEDRATGEITGAEFLHFTNRPIGNTVDPHMHGHYFLFNATFDAVEERTKAGQFGPMIENAPDLELEFDARFATRLREAGYVPVPGRYGFQLAGVPQ